MPTAAQYQALFKTTSKLIKNSLINQRITPDQLSQLLQGADHHDLDKSITEPLKALLTNKDQETRRIARYAIALNVLLQTLRQTLVRGHQPVNNTTAEMWRFELTPEAVVRLSLPHTDLCFWNPVCITNFFNALKESKATQLELDNSEFDIWSLNPDRVRAFAKGLNASNVTWLSLRSCRLNDWWNMSVDALAEGLKDSKLSYLDLAGNKLGKWTISINDIFDTDPISTLGKTIMNSSVAELDLSENQLGAWSNSRINNFFNGAVKQSKVTKLNLECNQLSLWTNDNVKAFANSIEASKLAELIVDNNSLGYWNFTQLKAFAKGIKGLAELSMGANELQLWDAQRFTAFANGVIASNIKLLTLDRNALGHWDIARVNAFAELVKRSKLTTLHMRDNKLDLWDVQRITAFANAVIDSNIVVLEWWGNSLGSWDISRVNAFAELIKRSKLTTFSVAENELERWEVQRITAFFDAVKASKITSLNMRLNDLSTWDIKGISAFTNILTDSKIIELDLTANKLGMWKLNCITLFATALKNSEIRDLNLISNFLHQLDEDCILELANAIKDSKIISLNLSYNQLGSMDNDCFKILVSALKNSKITVLDLTKNDFDNLDSEKWGALTDAIKTNPNICEIKGLPNDTPVELREALARNGSLRVLRDGLQNFALIPNETEAQRDARCEKLAEECMEQMQSFRAAEDHSAREFLEPAVCAFLATLLHTIRYRFDALLQQLHLNTKPVGDIYFDYLEYLYIHPEKNGQTATQNFMQTIQFALNSKQVPIIFTPQQQALHDTFLKSIFGIRTMVHNQQPIDIPTRLFLLRHLQLQAIRDASIAATISTSAAVTTAQASAGARDEIEKILKLANPNLFTDRTYQHNHEKAYINIFNKIQRAEIKKYLEQEPIKQLNSLITYWEDIQKKTSEFAKWHADPKNKDLEIEDFIKQFHHCVDNQGRLLVNSPEHLALFDECLSKLINTTKPKTEDERITQLQKLVCMFLSPEPSATNSKNLSFFKPQNSKNQTPKEILQQFNKLTRELTEPPQNLVILIQAIKAFNSETPKTLQEEIAKSNESTNSDAPSL